MVVPLSATDANRWALRLARLVTGRPKILVFSYCYHGSVDETFVVADADGTTRSRPGNVAPTVDPSGPRWPSSSTTSKPWGAPSGRARLPRCLPEPALANIGIVAPDDGFHTGLRALCDDTGTLLMIDETHTLSRGSRRSTAAWGLRPDVVTLGKAIAGGIPIGAFGLRDDLAARVLALVDDEQADIEDVGGIGGTLAGNALSMAAARACLGEVLTDGAFARMDDLAVRLVERPRPPSPVMASRGRSPRLGARAEYRFCSPAPRNGSESDAADDPELDEYLHLYLSNRGVLITPFHNMVLMCPATTTDDVDLHGRVFEEAVAALAG